LAVALFSPAALAVGDPAVLINEPTIKAALDAAKRNEPWTLEEQIRINEIPAPPFKEEVRAREMERLFKELGLKDVRIDKEGNVIGVRPGEKPTPNVVISAHLDTVFPEGTDVTVKREGNILRAPGIVDDTRGLAALLNIIRSLDEGKVRTAGTITFVGTVGEEGLGDLRGVKALFRDTLKDQIDFFISIDGTSINRITSAGVGSYRYRVTFKGTGGHSYGAFGLANPIHALGRAIDGIAEIQVPRQPKTTFNVGRIGGGTSVNSIAFEAWMEVDMRSETMVALEAVKEQFMTSVNSAVEAENKRWGGRGNLSVELELVGLRPAGETSQQSPIIKATNAAVVALGLQPIHSAGSTDSNVPMNLGVPAVTIGGGGSGFGAHALDEYFDSTDSHLGPQMAILLLAALTK
jgi:acetylornithine deacetylase/succinyl-diaminopimelate desuccinylase-like protein